MDLFFQQIANGLVVGSTYAVVSIGFALMYTVMRVVNLAHPDVMMLATFATLRVTTYLTRAVVIVIPTVIATGAAAGLVVERVVLRPLRSRSILMPLIATAGVSVLLQHGWPSIWGADPRAFPSLIPRMTISIGPVGLSLAQVVNIVTAGLMMVAVSYYVRGTRWGRATRALVRPRRRSRVRGGHEPCVSGHRRAFRCNGSGRRYHPRLAVRNHHGVPRPDLHTEGVHLHARSGQSAYRGRYRGRVVARNPGVAGHSLLTSTLRDAVAFGLLMVVLYVRPGGLFGSYAFAGLNALCQPPSSPTRF